MLIWPCHKFLQNFGFIFWIWYARCICYIKITKSFLHFTCFSSRACMFYMLARITCHVTWLLLVDLSDQYSVTTNCVPDASSNNSGRLLSVLCSDRIIYSQLLLFFSKITDMAGKNVIESYIFVYMRNVCMESNIRYSWFRCKEYPSQFQHFNNCQAPISNFCTIFMDIFTRL